MATTSGGEILIGKIALERGYITREQLEECVKVQLEESLGGDPEKTQGRKDARPLGVILVARGYLTDERLVELYDLRKKRIESLREYRLIYRSELLFGQLLIKMGKATQLQINKCLEAQRRMAEEGMTPLPRLGEILVEHGFVTAAIVQDALQAQNKRVMMCLGCEVRYNVVGIEEGRKYRCKKCGSLLVSADVMDSVRVDETTLGQEIEEA